MPKKYSTAFRYLAAGIYIRRVGDAIQIVTTGDQLEPDTGQDTSNVAMKSNWLTEQQVSVEQFADVVNDLAPEARGQLVNVGTDEEPFLLTQQQAARFGDVVDAAAQAQVTAAQVTPIPAR